MGGGALVAAGDGPPQEILRYTNACQKNMARAARFCADYLAYRKAREEKPDAPPPTLAADRDPRRRCPHCRLLLPEGTQVCPACINKGRVILRIAAYVRPYWKEALWIALLMFAGLGLSLIPPYLTRPLVDRVLVPPEPIPPTADRLLLLGGLVLALLGAQGLGTAVNIIRSRILARLGSNLSHDLRLKLYSHLQFMSIRFFEKRPVGAMMSRVIQDTESLEAVMVEGLQVFVGQLLTLVGIGAVLAVLNWKLALLVLIPVPLSLWVSKLGWPRIISLWRRGWHFRSRLSTSVNESLSGSRVIKAFARENAEINRFSHHSGHVRESNRIAHQTMQTFFPLLWLLVSTGSLLVWYVGGRQIIGGDMTLGVLMTFLAYLGMFYGPLNYLTRLADYLARSSPPPNEFSKSSIANPMSGRTPPPCPCAPCRAGSNSGMPPSAMRPTDRS